MKYTPEVEKRCILRMTPTTTFAGEKLYDLYYGIPGEFHFIRKFVRSEEEGRGEVETFKLKHRGEVYAVK